MDIFAMYIEFNTDRDPVFRQFWSYKYISFPLDKAKEIIAEYPVETIKEYSIWEMYAHITEDIKQSFSQHKRS
jgi:hypothetical protein